MFAPLFGPMKLTSSVNEFIKLNSRHITTRPQVSFDFWIAKQQSSKLNISEFWLKSLNYSQSYKPMSLIAYYLHGENLFFVAVLRLWLVVSKHEHVFSN